MKTIGIFTILAAVLLACGGEENVVVGNRTKIEVSANYGGNASSGKVSNEIYDAGEVVKGELIRAKFTVKNTGDYPLVIADVSTSCSCTVGDYTKDPIQPGETGEVIATVDTDRVGGAKVDKAVTLLANTQPSKTELKIKATIVKK
jgi:hypothetical protein